MDKSKILTLTGALLAAAAGGGILYGTAGAADAVLSESDCAVLVAAYPEQGTCEEQVELAARQRVAEAKRVIGLIEAARLEKIRTSSPVEYAKVKAILDKVSLDEPEPEPELVEP